MEKDIKDDVKNLPCPTMIEQSRKTAVAKVHDIPPPPSRKGLKWKYFLAG
jgi:hypothetical protein